MIVSRVFTILAVLLGCGMLLTGCSDHAPPSVSTGNLAQIDTMTLESRSIAPAVSIDQATTQATSQSTTQSLAPATRPDSAAAVQLTLEEVRSAALANNLDLKVELVNPAIAQQFVDAERAKFEATFDGSGAFARADSDGPKTDLQTYSAGITVPLRTGGTVTVNAPLTRSENGSADYGSAVNFSISQPLLRNAGFQANEYSIRIAEYQKSIVDVQTKLQAIRILANADRAYWALYSARGALEVNQRVYELALKQVDQAQKRFAADASPRIEITRAESGAAARLEGILLAQTVLQRRERDLKRILNRPDLPMDSTTEIIPLTQPNPVGLTLSAAALAQHALANRMEMLELELRLAADAETIDFERNQELPLFTLDYNYSLFRTSRNFGNAIDLTGNDDSAAWSVQLRGQIPIGNAAAKARVHRAILERLQRLGTRDQRRLSITQEVYDAIDQLNQDWQRILAARNESILAGRTYEAEQRQFELGVRTSTDVLDASVRLAAAQLREVEAITDYEISRIDIAFATGTLLGQGHVLLPNLNANSRSTSDSAN